MTAPDTARTNRERRKATFARELRRLMCEHDVSAQSLSVLLGVGHTKAVRYLDSDASDTLPASDVDALPPVILDALLSRWAEQRGLVLAAAPDAIEQGDDLRALAAVTSACGQVCAHLAESLADDRLDGQEAEAGERLVDDAMARLATLRERFRGVKVVRIDGIRRGGR